MAAQGARSNATPRIYWPETSSGAPAPVVLFAHGGGFVFCALDTHDDLCRDLCNGIRRFEAGYYNTRAAMAWYWDQYVPDAGDRSHPHASPLRADLSGLPAAVVITAGFDPLHSEGDDYAEALAAQYVPVVHRSYPGAIHGFMTMSALNR